MKTAEKGKKKRGWKGREMGGEGEVEEGVKSEQIIIRSLCVVRKISELGNSRHSHISCSRVPLVTLSTPL